MKKEPLSPGVPEKRTRWIFKIHCELKVLHSLYASDRVSINIIKRMIRRSLNLVSSNVWSPFMTGPWNTVINHNFVWIFVRPMTWFSCGRINLLIQCFWWNACLIRWRLYKRKIGINGLSTVDGERMDCLSRQNSSLTPSQNSGLCYLKMTVFQEMVIELHKFCTQCKMWYESRLPFSSGEDPSI